MKYKKSKSKIVRKFRTDVMLWSEAGTLDKNIASKATKKNHKHFHNPTFKSRAVLRVTPAQYRRTHKGSLVKRYANKKS